MLSQNINVSDARRWGSSAPFHHLIIDDFLESGFVQNIVLEFPSFSSDSWYVYENPIEIKKAMNNWDRFGPHTYALFWYLNSRSFIEKLEVLTNCK